MFETTSERNRYQFFNNNDGCHIPGYTGHCPTLRFEYGSSYGSKTKEILQELKQKKIISSNTPYRYNNIHDQAAIKPIIRTKDQTSDPAFQIRNKAPKYIIGYTGFVPTLNFRSGKSYSRTADDCMHDFFLNQQKMAQQEETNNRELKAIGVPNYTPIRDDVKYILRQNRTHLDRFKERNVTPESPPIAGYTGHIPKVKGNEESLSQRYNNVVKRSMKLVRDERNRHQTKYPRSNLYLNENDNR